MNRRYYFQASWKRVLRDLVRDWVEALRDAGHDMEVYGKAEMSNLKRRDTWQSLAWHPKIKEGSGEGPYRWKGFIRYGPHPEDWDLIWDFDIPLWRSSWGTSGTGSKTRPWLSLARWLMTATTVVIGR